MSPPALYWCYFRYADYTLISEGSTHPASMILIMLWGFFDLYHDHRTLFIHFPTGELGVPYLLLAMLPSTSSPLAVAELNGPVLYGMMVSCPLYGITVSQAISYYRTYPSDRLYLKIFVGVLLFMDTAHTCCLVRVTQYWYIDIQLLPITPKTLLATFFISDFSISMVQSAYAKRVWHVSGGNNLITGIILFCSLLQFVGGIGQVSVISASHVVGGIANAVNTHGSRVFGGLQLSSSVVCDMLITISLVYFLNCCRSGFRRTENLIDRLIVFSINLGLVTSIIAFLALVTWYTMEKNFDFLVFHFLIGKFYVNSLLVNLNSRANFQNTGEENTGEIDVNTISDTMLNAFRTLQEDPGEGTIPLAAPLAPAKSHHLIH